MAHQDMAHDVQKEVRGYLIVFGALLALTVLTVMVARLHLGSIGTAITIGLMIAVIKGSLVALFFMHLRSERRFIYWNLLLCAVFLMALFGLPLWAYYDHLDRKGEVVEMATAEGSGDAEESPAEEAPTLEGVSNQGGARTASIKGKVVFTGTAPKARKLDLSGNPDCSKLHAGGPGLFSERYVVGANGELANVLVFVSEGVTGEFPPPTEAVELDQKQCRYSPHVIALQVGQTLKIVNSDPFMHNVHPKPSSNPDKNTPMPKGSRPLEIKYRRAEAKPIPVVCDVHTWMNAYVAVLPHPYHAVTKEDGTFEFKEKIAPGTYILAAWHEQLGMLHKKIEVADGEVKEVETFEFTR